MAHPPVELEAELLLDAGAQLGEGPVWAHGVLAFVDIERCTAALVQTDGASAAIVATSKLPGRVGAVLPRAEGGWVAAVEDFGLLLLDERLRPSRPLCHPDTDANNRYNDGAVDPQGRIWIGTMRTKRDDPTGALYRVEADGRCERILDRLRVSNGIAWSPDAKTMYHTDTANNRVDAYDFDAPTGAIRNPRPAATVTDGWPDGHCVDSEGGLWVAHWAGGRVTRFDPSTGEPTHVVRVPCSNATSCCFIGPDLDVLAITTAREGVSAEKLETKEPHAGALFCARTGHAGLPQPLFAG